MNTKGKVNFYKRCEELRKNNQKLESSTYSEYSQMFMSEVCKQYDLLSNADKANL